MGYLDELKKNTSDPHQSLLGYSKPEGFDQDHKQALKKLIIQEEKADKTPRVFKWKQSYTRWAIAASFTILLGLNAYKNTLALQNESLSEEEILLLNALFAEEEEVDSFLDTSLAEALIQDLP